MSELKVHLFKRLSISHDDHLLKCFNSQKAKELFCYLLIFRNQTIHREILAEKLWRDIKIENKMKYLRKALWQLQSYLNPIPDFEVENFLKVEPKWLRVDTVNVIWLDIAKFEKVYKKVRKIRGKHLSQIDYTSVKEATEIYEGDLLEGWYQSWIIFERERLKEMLIAMVGKLMSFCEAKNEYEIGIEYGNQLLKYDRAHERTHRRLMRIQYLAGDRTSAIRQFQRCKQVLQEELSVKPSERTNKLYQEIVEGDEKTSQDLVEINKDGLTSSYPGLVYSISQIRNRMINQAIEQKKIIHKIYELENKFKEID